jgi:AcrR family transcriptional regulator
MAMNKELQDDVVTERDGAARIRRAAIALFRARGFHGTSVRQLAEAADMESASLYYHYPSKQSLLMDLFHHTMNELIEGAEQAIASQVDATARLRAAVLFHVRFHIHRQDEATISHSELRALIDPDRAAIIAKRDRYERLFRNVLESGREEGVFEFEDAALTSTAMLMMCSGVSDWFGGRGRLSAQTVAGCYVDMALRLVQVGGCVPART